MCFNIQCWTVLTVALSDISMQQEYYYRRYHVTPSSGIFSGVVFHATEFCIPHRSCVACYSSCAIQYTLFFSENVQCCGIIVEVCDSKQLWHSMQTLLQFMGAPSRKLMPPLIAKTISLYSHPCPFSHVDLCTTFPTAVISWVGGALLWILDTAVCTMVT